MTSTAHSAARREIANAVRNRCVLLWLDQRPRRFDRSMTAHAAGGPGLGLINRNRCWPTCR